MRSNITMLMPSTKRRDKAEEAMKAFNENSRSAELLLVLNDGEDYDLPINTIHVSATCLGEAINLAVSRIDTKYVGFIGDDHLIRTKDWDLLMKDALKTHPIVYGDDLLQGESLPTQVVMRTEVAVELGYMALPGLNHLFIDNFWLELGAHFVPGVVIEHMHYTVGKSKKDEVYTQVNSSKMFEHDRAVFQKWLVEGKERDLEIVDGI